MKVATPQPDVNRSFRTCPSINDKKMVDKYPVESNRARTVLANLPHRPGRKLEAKRSTETTTTKKKESTDADGGERTDGPGVIPMPREAVRIAIVAVVFLVAPIG